MRWQNPWAWLGLLALVLPVLVHLFSRRQTRIEPFPTLRFIDVSRLLPTRRTRLTDVLLLLVRMLLIATAVAALAQPLWRNRARASSDTSATVVIVDTVAVGGISADDTTVRAVARADLDQALHAVIESNTSLMRVDTDAPVDALSGATAWLATQHGRHHLIIASDFRDGTLDSMDLALLPRDITVRLLSRSANASGAPRALNTSGVVWWAPTSATSPEVRSAVANTVRTLGAVVLADSVPPSVRRVIVVATRDADSLSTWLREARPIADAWMGDVIVRLRADTTLVSASSDVDLTDTTFASPLTVLARTSSNAPVVATASLGTGAAARLLLVTRTASDALATAALLLGASRSLEPSAITASGRPAPDSAQLLRWERAPAGAPTPPASVGPNDALTGPSDARWLWLAVLVLLVVETILRRQSRAGLSGAAPGQRPL